MKIGKKKLGKGGGETVIERGEKLGGKGGRAAEGNAEQGEKSWMSSKGLLASWS